MVFPIQVTVIEERPPDIVVREWRSIRHGTHYAMGTFWHAHMLGDRFKANAHQVYKFKRRSEKYTQAKKEAARTGRKLSGGRVSPAAATAQLTKSGLLHAAMTQRGRVIRSFESRFTVRMPGTSYTPRKPRDSKRPNLQKELTTLLKREIDTLQKVGEDKAVELINSTRQRRQTTLK
jgi:hypothetical protein